MGTCSNKRKGLQHCARRPTRLSPEGYLTSAYRQLRRRGKLGGVTLLDSIRLYACVPRGVPNSTSAYRACYESGAAAACPAWTKQVCLRWAGVLQASRMKLRDAEPLGFHPILSIGHGSCSRMHQPDLEYVRFALRAKRCSQQHKT